MRAAHCGVRWRRGWQWGWRRRHWALFGTASATCIGFSGFSIGDGCTTELGTIAFVLGDGTATATGFFTGAIAIGDSDAAVANGLATAAWAGGTGSEALARRASSTGPFAQGDERIRTGRPSGLLDFVNVAFNFGNARSDDTSRCRCGG